MKIKNCQLYSVIVHALIKKRPHTKNASGYLFSILFLKLYMIKPQQVTVTPGLSAQDPQPASVLPAHGHVRSHNMVCDISRIAPS